VYLGGDYETATMKTAFLVLLAAAALVQAQPYQPTAIWQREGAGDSSYYGSEILALGDQNGDGFNDWAVYAGGLGYAPPGSPNEPKVEFFHGGNPPDTTPYMVRVKDPATEVAIRGARALGDLNGDGYVDWYVFTSYVGDSTGGHIYKIYFGGPGPHNVPDLILTSPIQSGYKPIGDFNGDGFDDVMLFDWQNDRSLVFCGGNAMDTLSDWSRSQYLGSAEAGDLNGDSFADFVTYDSQTYIDIYLGAQVPDTLPYYHWPITTSWRYIVRDLNGDGYDELCYSRPGRINVHYGGTTMQPDPSTWLDFPCSGGLRTVVSARDFNHDGYNDVVTFSDYCDDSWYGTLSLHLGGSWLNPAPAFTITGWTEPLNLIHFKSATTLGDVNGDGIDDLGVGAGGGVEYIAQRGKAVVLRGDDSLIADAPQPPNPLPQSLEVIAYPNPFNSEATITLHFPASHEPMVLTIFNVLGREVRREFVPRFSGEYVYHLSAGDLSSGLYLATVKSGSLQATQKLMLLK
jgi:hypothetical protein